MDATPPLAPLLLLLLVLLPLALLRTAGADSDIEDDSSLREKRATRGFTLAFVFDSTGSMSDELNQVKKAMQEIFDHMKANHKNEIENYALVEFNDPYAKLLTITTDAKVYQKSLNKIRVHGGDDCPEMAMKGIKLALEKSLPNSYIFVFTDASAKDYKNQVEVENLIQRKKSKVVFVLTGMCRGENEPGYKAYYDVSRVSNGRVFNILKNEVTKVLQFIKQDTERKNVIASGEISGKKDITIPVDPTMQKFTATVSGQNSKLGFISPTGKKEEGKTILNIKTVQSKEVLKPVPGNWKIQMETKSPGVYDVTTKNTFDFMYGFSIVPAKSIEETAPRPLIGKVTSLFIQMVNQTNHIQLIDVKLKDKEKVLKKLELHAVLGKNDTYNAEMFLPPKSVFFLEVSGKDSKNNSIVRLLNTGITPQLPALPIITLKSELTATLKSPFTLTCHVESLVPFTGSWFKESVNVMPDKNFIQSAQLFYNINKTEMSSAGTYTCKAKNAAGSVSKNVKLTVQAPPPSVKTPKIIELQYNERGEIPCQVQSDADFKVTWTKKETTGSVQRLSGGKFTTKPTGNLIISHAEISDEGEYHCSATNTFGTAESPIWVKVLQPVHVVANSEKLKFRSQEHFQLSCSASGSEPITLVWKKNGKIIQDSDKRLQKPDKRKLVLKIQYAQMSDAGTYVCEASNRINKVNQTLELKFIERPQVKISPPHSPPFAATQYTLTCLVTGSPKPKVSWTKDGNDILSRDFEQVLANGTLVIPHLLFNHTGEYQCTAENEIGKVSTKTSIEVVSKPYFDSNRKDIHVEINKNVSFKCNLHGNPEPKVKWERKDGKTLPKRFSKEGSSCSMILIEAQPEDTGTYVVTATNKYGMQKKHFELHITGMVKPILANGSSEEITIVGQQKELTCLIQKGIPFPIFSWYKDGEKLESEDLLNMKGRIFKNGSLIISYIKPDNEGTYKCEASNVAGTTTRSLNLKVFKAPVFFGNKYVKLTARLGTKVQLTCQVYGKPKPKITWKKDNKEIIFSSSITLNPEDDSILINSTIKENNGTYECVAANSLGKNKKKIDLLIQDPPKISPPSSTDIFIKKGEEVTLHCEVQAYPEAKIQWFKNGTPFETSSVHYSHNNSSLRLAADSSPSGKYTCLATNDAGHDEIAINVTETVEPLFEKTEEYIQASRGDNVTLSCTTDAVPPAEYFWLKDPDTELTESDSIITFENVNDSIAGLYHCYASNRAGDAQKVFEIQINVQPLIVAEIPKKHSLKEGSYISIPCYATGVPNPTIRWLKNGKPLLSLEDTNVLEIKNATKEDSGLYTCEAENHEGLDKKSVEIKV